MKLSPRDLFLICCASAYEQHDAPFISDFHYDLEAIGMQEGMIKALGLKPDGSPVYSAYTSLWVTEIMDPDLDNLMSKCLSHAALDKFSELGYGEFVKILEGNYPATLVEWDE